jgi:hypothetical protein
LTIPLVFEVRTGAPNARARYAWEPD